jgi:hypothetical protein
MTVLTLHGQQIETVFDLLGQKENDLTYALGWALAHSPKFLRQLATAIGFKDGFSDRTKIRLQEHSSTRGLHECFHSDKGGPATSTDWDRRSSLLIKCQPTAKGAQFIRQDASGFILIYCSRRGAWPKRDI